MGYLVGAASAARLPLRPAQLALLALLATAALTARMAWPGPPRVWAVCRLLAGVASAWAFVGTSVWCLQALARGASTGWNSALYAGVGGGMALAGLYCLAGGGLRASAGHFSAGAGPHRGDRPAPVRPGLAGVWAHGRRFGAAGRLVAAAGLAAAGLAVSQALMGVGVLLPSLWLAGGTIALSALARAGTPAVAGMTTAFALGQIAGPVVSNLLPRWPGLTTGGSLDLALQLGAAGLFGSALWLWRTAQPRLSHCASRS